MDEGSGRILYNKNGSERKANASTTKIMTCILALEYGNEDDIVTFSANAARQPDVQMNGCEGEQYYLKDLLFALMLESHNDVAVAIAEHIAGDVETFAGYMNDKAQEVGAFDTHFVTPNGLDADDHYTTACDLAIIARYALQNKEFQEIIRTPAHTFSEISGKRNVAVVNRDGFLTQYEGAIGIKTGFTGNAGYCFVGAAKKNGMTLISVVLASGWPPHKTYKWTDTKQLMDYGFSNYSVHTIPDVSIMVPEIPVDRGVDADTVCVCLKEGTSISVPMRENETVRYEWNLPDETKAPVQKGCIAGTVDIYIDQELFASEVLYYAENVEAITYYHELIYVFRRLFMI
ncbi:MAG: D-alanyl-D-alanine carboxypeptidase [Lachnospiraceae bacterium]|nr:D-alanyl-D-alanine carboxypeptidase [Lachnospiraceae bacterium]